MDRVAIVGSSGSGKTTLGRAVARRIDAPFVELDALHHRPGWAEASTPELRAAVAEALDTERWVVDGNYRTVADLTQMRADTVVWLDLPRWLVTWRVAWRSLTRIVRREELWQGNRESLRRLVSRDPERSIIVWTWQQHPQYQRRYTAQLDEKIWAHADVYRLRSRRDVDRWLAAACQNAVGVSASESPRPGGEGSMGLLDEIDYSVKPANAVQRAMQSIAASRPGSWVFQKTLYALDRPLHRWSGGRLTVPGLVAGLPVILLTTTGAKSGKPRTMPLVGVPVGDDVAVIGSNYGQEHTPGWVYNLRADPSATLVAGDREIEVDARQASPSEADEIFERASDIYPGFGVYRERANHREISVFVLSSATEASTSG